MTLPFITTGPDPIAYIPALVPSPFVATDEAVVISWVPPAPAVLQQFQMSAADAITVGNVTIQLIVVEAGSGAPEVVATIVLDATHPSVVVLLDVSVDPTQLIIANAVASADKGGGELLGGGLVAVLS